MRKCLFIFIMTMVMGSVAHGLSDDFEDGTINTSLWVTGRAKRGYRTDIPPGVGNWNYDDPPEEIVDATDGYLSMHVWGPTSGNTYGAEAWVRTKHDFNDGKSYLINFTWEPEFIDWHFNYYYLQITDDYIPVYGNVHWANEYDDPGTVNLLRQLESGGSLSRGWHYQNSPPVGKLNYSITIDQTGIVKLYDAPNAGGTLLREEPLDPGSPWYIRFMTIDATSSGFPAGECRLNLYDFSAVVTTPGPPPGPPWSFVHITDTHVGYKEGKKDSASNNLDAAVSQILTMSNLPDFVLVTGDVVDYGCNSNGCINDHYLDFMFSMMPLSIRGINYYVVPGNHDRSEGLPGLGKLCACGLCCYNEHYLDHQDFVHNSFLFIGLDTGDGHFSGGLSDTMISFYKQQGVDNPSLPKIIFMHHPGVDEWGINESIKDKDFLDWCDNNKVRLVLAGHTHEDHISDRDGNPRDNTKPIYVQTPSCGKPRSGGDSIGFRIINVNSPVDPQPYELTNRQNNMINASLQSPGNLHVYDSDGRHVGIGSGGEVEYGIPDSFYHSHYTVNIEGSTVVYPERINIFDPTDDYLHEVVGTESGTYGLDITSVSGGVETIFEATDIPTSPGADHIYAVDWSTLSAGGEGVVLNIDNNGDGVFEQMIIADNDLTSDEFALQTEVVIDFDPDTLNLKSKGKFVTVYIELPGDIDVSDIDISSLRLNESVSALPKPIAIGDYDSDGTSDLMVKFDRQELITTLGLGEEQMVNLSGELLDGKRFAGFDFVRVIHESQE